MALTPPHHPTLPLLPARLTRKRCSHGTPIGPVLIRGTYPTGPGVAVKLLRNAETGRVAGIVVGAGGRCAYVAVVDGLYRGHP